MTTSLFKCPIYISSLERDPSRGRDERLCGFLGALGSLGCRSSRNFGRRAPSSGGGLSRGGGGGDLLLGRIGLGLEQHTQQSYNLKRGERTEDLEADDEVLGLAGMMSWMTMVVSLRQ